MVTRLLWIELVFDGVLGLALLLAPILTIRLLGLPSAGLSFWPRLSGGLLIGMALATAAGGMGWTASGLGLGGRVAINVVLAFVVAAMLVNGPAIPTRRGRVLLWLLTLALSTLALVEIAWAT